MNILKRRQINIALPRPRAGKHDLSYNSPWGRKRQANTPDSDLSEHGDLQETNIRVHHILALYASALESRLQDDENGRDATYVEDRFHKEIHKEPRLVRANRYLASRGYTWRDVKLWYRILTAEDEAQAATELAARSASQQLLSSAVNRIPTPVYLFFLRRQYLSPKAVRLCVEYAFQEARYVRSDRSANFQVLMPAKDGNQASDRVGVINRSAFIVIIVRLLRHARRSLPEVMPSICKLLTLMPTFQDDCVLGRKHRTRNRKAASRLCVIYNRVLKLLSLPPNASPYHSVAIIQRAQFDLLGFMASHEPIIAINREGYRAISQVQLANKKTAREQDWARLKMKTWPPWKEDRMGFDSEKGPEYGVSRALEAIRKAREAGYGSRMWEEVATILSGWDTDQSPTIQTRAYLLHQRIARDNRSKQIRFEVSLWSARVRATRTAQEAWACFLAYEDRIQGEIPPNQSVYLAMLEKLHAEHRAKRQRERGRVSESQSSNYGGDSREVLPVSDSPKEQTYVRVPQLSMDELANQMHGKGIIPKGDCLAFLVANAHSTEDGFKYLYWASRLNTVVDDLLFSQERREEASRRVSSRLFDAYIEFLCRNNSFPKLLQEHVSNRTQTSVQMRKEPAAFLAYRLLRSRKTASSTAWYMVARRMMSTPLPYDLRRMVSTSPDVETIERWGFVRSVVRQMHEAAALRIEARIFLLLNQALGPAIIAAYQIIQQSHKLHKSKDNSDSRRTRRSITSFAESVLGSSTKAPGAGAPRTAVHEDFEEGSVKSAERLLKESGRYLQDIFDGVFGEGGEVASGSLCNTSKTTEIKAFDEAMSLPRLMSTPYPPLLHAYVRSLGLLKDWQSLLWLSKWMVAHGQEIDEAAEMPANGLQMRRRTIVAFRAFLERPWLSLIGKSDVGGGAVRDPHNSNGSNPQGGLEERSSDANHSLPRTAAPQLLIDEIKAELGSHESWGGWPSDKEMLEYCYGPTAGDLPVE